MKSLEESEEERDKPNCIFFQRPVLDDLLALEPKVSEEEGKEGKEGKESKETEPLPVIDPSTLPKFIDWSKLSKRKGA